MTFQLVAFLALKRKVSREYKLKKGLILVLTLISAIGFSQTRSSFVSVSQITGVTVNQSNAGLTYSVSVAPNAQYTNGSDSYDIDEVLGFWVMRNSNPDLLNPTNADFGQWDKKNSTTGSGEIAGWKSVTSDGIDPNQSQTYSFASLNSSAIEAYGFKVRLSSESCGGSSEDMRYITAGAVPEPATMAALGLGTVALIRRRKK
jgi:hypothetical protein